MSDPIKIGGEVEGKLREWVAAGRGWCCWENREIGSSHARHVFTPLRDAGGERLTGAPDWRYRIACTSEEPHPMIVQRWSAPLKAWRARVKDYYWGAWLTKASEAKASREAKRLGAEWYWEYADDGSPTVYVAKRTTEPFTG